MVTHSFMQMLSAGGLVRAVQTCQFQNTSGKKGQSFRPSTHVWTVRILCTERENRPGKNTRRWTGSCATATPGRFHFILCITTLKLLRKKIWFPEYCCGFESLQSDLWVLLQGWVSYPSLTWFINKGLESQSFYVHTSTNCLENRKRCCIRYPWQPCPCPVFLRTGAASSYTEPLQWVEVPKWNSYPYICV